MTEEKLNIITADSSTPVKEEDANKLLVNFSTLLKDPVDRKRFVDSITKGTDRWSIRHKGPYYRAKFALQLKQVIDEMMINKKSRIYRYKDFPDLASHNTLYLKIIQSKAYLLDFLDNEGKYKLFFEAILITKKKGVGVILHLRTDILSEDEHGHVTFSPDYLSDDHADSSWKDDLEKYLQSDTKDPLELKGLALSETECRDIEIQLSQISTISYRVTSDRIVIVKD